MPGRNRRHHDLGYLAPAEEGEVVDGGNTDTVDVGAMITRRTVLVTRAMLRASARIFVAMVTAVCFLMDCRRCGGLMVDSAVSEKARGGLTGRRTVADEQSNR